jgi:protein-disulfide isomerase
MTLSLGFGPSGLSEAHAQAQAAAPAGKTVFSKDEEARVRQIVREYLVQNPEVLDEAIGVLRARQEQQRRVQMETDPRHFAIGPKDAKITIVEFFDYRCPYCKASLEWMMNVVRTRKDVRVVFKEYPVLGPASLEASKAAVASIRQGKYLAFHQALMASKGDLNSKLIDDTARKVGIDVARLRKDMTDPAIAKLIDDNHDVGAQARVDGTPAFLVNGEWVRGADFAALDKLVSGNPGGGAKKTR